MNLKKRPLIFGLSGNAGCGKDTLCKKMQNLLSINGKNSARISFGDIIRVELNDFIYDEFNIDIFKCSSKEKEIIRPIMVEYGRAKRKMSNGRYFIDKINSAIEFYQSTVNYFILTDLRYFQEYGSDEFQWLTKEVNGISIYIERYINKNEKIEPANTFEKENNEKIRQNAHYIVKWKTTNDEKYLLAHANLILKKFEII